MLWNAAKRYFGRKRMQRKSEKEKEKKTKIRDCIEAPSGA
jgi:hypothetical protein